MSAFLLIVSLCCQPASAWLYSFELALSFTHSIIVRSTCRHINGHGSIPLSLTITWVYLFNKRSHLFWTKLWTKNCEIKVVWAFTFIILLTDFSSYPLFWRISLIIFVILSSSWILTFKCQSFGIFFYFSSITLGLQLYFSFGDFVL